MSLDFKWRGAPESDERSAPVTDMHISYDREHINEASDWNRPHDGIHEYSAKIDMVSAAAERTKSSVLEKYGDCYRCFFHAFFSCTRRSFGGCLS